MCRHLAYLGPPRTLAALLLAPRRGLYEQSWAPRRQTHGVVNADGFGFGWYPQDGDGEPARYRRAVPIWADPNVPELAGAVRSGAVLAAVRSATAGTSQDEAAAAPLRDGRYLFSHNGAIPDWTRLPADLGDAAGLDAAALLSLEARSDSALLWALIATRLRRGEPAGQAVAGVLHAVAEVRPTARLNVLLTDGRHIVAARHGDTLWYRETGDEVLVASEPDEQESDHPWHEVPDHSLLLAAVRGGAGEAVRIEQARTRSENTVNAVTDRFTLDHRLPPDHYLAGLREDVRRGLAAPPRILSPKWFYDERGSELFEKITALPEYYLTRAEFEILTEHAPEIAAAVGAATLVELGSGSSRKTRLLLDALSAAGSLRCYAPVDVSASALTAAGAALCEEYPALRVAATVADFEQDLAFSAQDPAPRLLAFLGSTLGNFDPGQRRRLYGEFHRALGGQDALLLGADLVKGEDVLVPAYNDAMGITAEFDKNVLQVINRELDADFDPGEFDHVAVWNAQEERIEMRLRSRKAQNVKVRGLDLVVDFAAGEQLRTEISAKFRRESLTAELEQSGFGVQAWWTDRAGRFALLLARPVAR
jgi:dimethylhistidine N-methyltransferase/ergothioneine biosynthesis protein EgtC